jgi:glyoxylase-like metal-dependent hydrolase (beta-lactamase superfamily II)
MNNLTEPLADQIFFVMGERSGRYPYSHSLLINDYLIDTGISDRRIKKLKRTYDVKNVLLTHWHEDHISGNNMLENAKFYCHPKDKFLIEDISKMNEYYGMIDTPSENDFDEAFEMLNMSNTEIDGEFEDGTIFNLDDGKKLSVIHSPGHSAGHCCFIELNSRIAFLADIDLTSFGPYYAGLDSSVIDFEASVKKMIDIDMDIAVTSHKGLFTGKKLIREKLNDFLSHIYERDKLILEQLSETIPRNVEDLSHKNIIYKFYSNYENYEIVAEKIMFQYHFDKFLKNNIIEPKDNGYVLC